MPNPLLEFDSPRRAYNADEYTATNSGVILTGRGTKLTSNLLLGPGLTVTMAPSSPAPGAVQYAMIVSEAITARVESLEAQMRVLLANLSLQAEEAATIREPSGAIRGTPFIGNVKAASASNLLLIAEDGTQCVRVQPNDAVTATLAVLAGKLGFYQEAPVDQQTVPLGSSTDDVIAALQALGLIKE